MNATTGGQSFGVWEQVTGCGGVNEPTFVMEPLTITGVNTFAPLGSLVNGSFFMIVVNGRVFLPVGIGKAFTVTGQQITWTSTSYSVFPGDGTPSNPGDDAVAIYSYYASM